MLVFREIVCTYYLDGSVNHLAFIKVKLYNYNIARAHFRSLLGGPIAPNLVS